jgi:hypothetical protein
MRDDRDLVPGLVASERDLVGAEQPLHLGRHRVEDRRRLRAFRNQRRDAPERGLLGGQPLDLGARLHVGDRGRHQLREVGEPALRPGPERAPA